MNGKAGSVSDRTVYPRQVTYCVAVWLLLLLLLLLYSFVEVLLYISSIF
eukprot:COSAG01_NODE_279_length_19520_cov_41.772154_15_plen_49_part_00